MTRADAIRLVALAVCIVVYLAAISLIWMSGRGAP